MQNANTAALNNTRRPPPPALNPESPGLVQPFKEFVQKGWISSLKVEFTPFGVNMVATVGDMVPGKPQGNVTIGQAKDAIVKAGLWSPRTRGSQGKANQEQARPAKSLVKKDFEDGPAKLAERVRAIAQALTDTTARGRIGSLKMYIEGADTFAKWWNSAEARDKVRLFSDQKRFNDFSQGDFDLFGQSVSECPFRGPVPTPTEGEEDQQEKPAPPTPPKAEKGGQANNNGKGKQPVSK